MPKRKQDNIQELEIKKPEKEQSDFETQKTKESPSQPEKPVEQPKEKESDESDESKIRRTGHKPKPIQIPTRQDPQVEQIEKILEGGLGDAYSRLSPVAKQEFKLRGEQTAMKINELLKSSHVKIKKNI